MVGWLIEGFVYPFNNRKMMIDGIPNRPLYFYQKDIIVDNWIWWRTIIYGLFMFVHKRQVLIQNMALFFQNSLHRLMFPWGLSVSLGIISMGIFSGWVFRWAWGKTSETCDNGLMNGWIFLSRPGPTAASEFLWMYTYTGRYVTSMLIELLQLYVYVYVYIHTHIYIYNYIYIWATAKKPGNTKYVLDGHWFMEIDGTC